VKLRLIIAALLALASAAWADAPTAIVPDPLITPGSVRTTDAAEICSSGTRKLRHWSRDRADFILREYSLPPGPYPQYEIDHLVPLGYLGAMYCDGEGVAKDYAQAVVWFRTAADGPA
jgi:TPR repeat protein